MKKFRMVLVVVMAMMFGFFGKDVHETWVHRNDDKFVKTTFYKDDIFLYEPHEKWGSTVDYVTLDRDRGINGTGVLKNGQLVFTLYEGEDHLETIRFERYHRVSDDQTRVLIYRGNSEPDAVVYKEEPELFYNVVMTELKSL